MRNYQDVEKVFKSLLPMLKNKQKTLHLTNQLLLYSEFSGADTASREYLFVRQIFYLNVVTPLEAASQCENISSNLECVKPPDK